MESAAVDHRHDVIAGDVDVDLLPRGPAAIDQIELPVVVDRGIGAGPADHVEPVDAGCEVVVAVVIVVALDAQADDLEVRDLLDLLEVAAERGLGVLGGEVALQKVVLELAEERCLVAAQPGLDPVLGIEEDPAAGLPEPVVLERSPLAPAVARDRVGALVGGDPDRRLLEVEEHPLHEHLHRAHRLLEMRGHLAGAHLDVDQVVREQRVGVAEAARVRPAGAADHDLGRLGALRALDVIADQRVAAMLAQDWLADGRARPTRAHARECSHSQASTPPNRVSRSATPPSAACCSSAV